MKRKAQVKGVYYYAKNCLAIGFPYGELIERQIYIINSVLYEQFLVKEEFEELEYIEIWG
ncbi:hypothetical protein H5T87_02085 [bacterium]|nr:hypothetical protein [bacterium]